MRRARHKDRIYLFGASRSLKTETRATPAEIVKEVKMIPVSRPAFRETIKFIVLSFRRAKSPYFEGAMMARAPIRGRGSIGSLLMSFHQCC